MATRKTPQYSVESLLHRSFLPWVKRAGKVRNPSRQVPGVCLRHDAYAGLLIQPLGEYGPIMAELVPMALRPGDIVIHRHGSDWSVHFVAGDFLGEVPCLVSSSDFRLRVSDKSPVCAPALFYQLVSKWKPESPFNIRGLCLGTKVTANSLLNEVSRTLVKTLVDACDARAVASRRVLAAEASLRGKVK